MKRLFLFSTLFIFLFSSVSADEVTAAKYDIIPLPKEVKVMCTGFDQMFAIEDGNGISYDASNAECTRIAQFLQEWVKEEADLKLQLTPDDKNATIKLRLVSPAAPKGKKSKKPVALTDQQKESYTMKVTEKGIELTAYEPVGLFRAAQTLRKSLPEKNGLGLIMPFAEITDQPRFSYRGVLLDCGRHFFSVEFIKQFLDVMALHGCNQFHWHLTEDQGWRFEVRLCLTLLRKEAFARKPSSVPAVCASTTTSLMAATIRRKSVAMWSSMLLSVTSMSCLKSICPDTCRVPSQSIRTSVAQVVRMLLLRIGV